jgi:hypothetical protein
MRRRGPFSEGQSAVFAELNRGKKSVIADFATSGTSARVSEPLGSAGGTHGNLPTGEGLLEMHAL